MPVNASAQTGQISIGFHAVVTSVQDDSNLLGGKMNAGDTLGGKFFYLLSATNSNASAGNGAYNFNSGAGIKVHTANNGMLFATDTSNINFLIEIVKNKVDALGIPWSHFVVRSYNNLPLSDDVTVDHISWQLDNNQTVSDGSTALPTTPINLSDWDQTLSGLLIRGKSASNDMASYEIHARVTHVYLWGN